MNSYFESYSSLGHLQNSSPCEVDSLKKSIITFFSGHQLKGQKIFLADENPLRFALTFLFFLDHGAVPVPVSQNFKGAADTLIENLIWKKKDFSKPIETDPPHYICLSSGTTGAPKHLALGVQNAFRNAQAHAAGFGITHEHTLIQTLPVYHSYGVIAFIFTPLITQAKVDFNPGVIGLRSFKNKQKKIIHVSPAQARFILKDKFENPIGIEKITIGAGSITYNELEALQKKFPAMKFYVSYGLTEAGPRVTAGCWTENPQIPRPENGQWIGQALPNIQVAVWDGKNISPEGTGLLCVKSESLYLNSKSDEFVDSWYKTRDQVHITEGQIYFLSRTDDIIKCGGFTLFPAEIENQFRSIPHIKDVIVLKQNDPVYDEVPILFVEGEIAEAELERFISENFPPALAPRKFLITKRFPRLSLNKVDRNQLREMMKEKM